MLAAAAILATTLVGVPVAHAQAPGYPPPPCPIVVSSQVLGSLTVGSTVTFSLSAVCAWTSGASVDVTVNGVFVGTKTVSASGTITVLVEALSPTLLSIDDPVLVPAQCGTNAIQAVGPSAVARTPVTHTGTFQLICPVPVTQPPPPKRQVAFTGDHVATLAATATLAMAWGAFLVVSGRRRRSGGIA